MEAQAERQIVDQPIYWWFNPRLLVVVVTCQAACCDQLPKDLKGVVVRSAGWSDGNRAEFWMTLGHCQPLGVGPERNEKR